MDTTVNLPAEGTGPSGRPRQGCRAAAALRELRFEDYGELRSLHERNGLSIRPEAEWREAWAGNPAFEKRRERWAIGWGLTDAAGAIVGAIGNLPVEYRLEGAPLLAAAAFAWVVDAGFRGHSLRLLLELMRQPVDFVFSTTVTPQSEAALRALGWLRVPAGQWNRAEFWVTNCAGFARAALLRRPGFSRTWISYPVSCALHWVEAVSRRSGWAKPGVGLEVCHRFDERWDALWERMQVERPGVLLAVRSRQALEWHFRRALARGELTVVASRGGSGLDAYAVFDRQDQPTCGLRRLRLVDWQALAGAEERLHAVLGWMLQRSRDEGIDVLEVSGGWLPSLKAAGLGPRFARRLPSWSYYFRAAAPQMSTLLMTPAVWTPSSYDGDASI